MRCFGRFLTLFVLLAFLLTILGVFVYGAFERGSAPIMYDREGLPVEGYAGRIIGKLADGAPCTDGMDCAPCSVCDTDIGKCVWVCSKGYICDINSIGFPRGRCVNEPGPLIPSWSMEHDVEPQEEPVKLTIRICNSGTIRGGRTIPIIECNGSLGNEDISVQKGQCTGYPYITCNCDDALDWDNGEGWYFTDALSRYADGTIESWTAYTSLAYYINYDEDQVFCEAHDGWVWIPGKTYETYDLCDRDDVPGRHITIDYICAEGGAGLAACTFWCGPESGDDDGTCWGDDPGEDGSNGDTLDILCTSESFFNGAWEDSVTGGYQCCGDDGPDDCGYMGGEWLCRGPGGNWQWEDASADGNEGIVIESDCGDALYVSDGTTWLECVGNNFVIKPFTGAYYPFDGNADDAIGYNDGIIDGAVLATGHDGTPNLAYSFDGVDGYIRFSSSLEPEEITIALWVKTTTSSGWNPFVSNYWWEGKREGYPGYNEYGYWFGLDDGKVDWYLNQGTDTGLEFISTTNVADDDWHFAAATFDGSTARVYVDDGPAEDSGSANPIVYSGEPLTIGSDSDGKFFEGQIDNVLIIDRALSDSEVLDLYNAGHVDEELFSGPYPISTDPVTGLPPHDYICNNSQIIECTGSPNCVGNRNIYDCDPDDQSTWCQSGSEGICMGKGAVITVEGHPNPYFCSSDAEWVELTDDAYDSSQEICQSSVGSDKWIDGKCCEPGDYFAPGCWDGINVGALLKIDDNPDIDTGERVLNLNSQFYGCGMPGIPKDMVSYWRLSNTDDSVLSNDGTAYGAGAIDDRFGNPYSAFHFDGIGDYIDIPYDPSLEPSEVTVALWFKQSSVPSTRYAFISNWIKPGTDGTGEYGYWLGIGKDSKVLWYLGHDDQISALRSSKIEDNQWHHVVATSDGSTAKVYVDGVLEASESTDPIVYYDTHISLKIGRDVSGYYFGGRIDDVMIFDRALTPAEVRSLYDGADSCNITGNHFCDIDTFGARDHWKPMANEAPSNEDTGSLLSGADALSPSFSPPPTAVPQTQGCCPSDFCWTGDSCKTDQTGDTQKTYDETGDDHLPNDGYTGILYQCFAGDWISATPKMDQNYVCGGFCDEDQCYHHSPGDCTDAGDCYEAGEYVGGALFDDYCERRAVGDEFWEWTTRTKFVALDLLKFVHSGTAFNKDFTLACGDYDKVLNDPGAQGVAGQLDKFCVLEYYEPPPTDRKIRVIGAALEKGTINARYSSLLELVAPNGRIDYCDDAMGVGYQMCNSDRKIWFNNDTEILLFSNTLISPVAEPGGFIASIYGFLYGLVDWIITPNSIPTPDLYTSYGWDFPDDHPVIPYIDKTRRFDRLYMSKKGSKEIIAILERPVGDPSSIPSADATPYYEAIKYEGFNIDMCELVKMYDDKSCPLDMPTTVDCFYCVEDPPGTYKVFASYEASGYGGIVPAWIELTSKLRIE